MISKADEQLIAEMFKCGSNHATRYFNEWQPTKENKKTD